MTVEIPMWLIWTGAIVGGAFLLMAIGAIGMFAYIGWKMRNFHPFR